MEQKVKFRDLLSQGQLFSPCVYDCMSARAADLCGYKSMMLSGGALSYSMCGLPDMAFTCIEEVVWITERITNVSPWPLIVDSDDGFGESPAVVYRNMARLAKAGAMGVTVDDSTGIRGVERLFAHHVRDGNDVVPREVWLRKIKASIDACKGTDCVVIARTEVELDTKEGFREAIERGLCAKALGAEMVMLRTHTTEEGRLVAKYIPGWKMWPDVSTTNGKPNADLDEIYQLGYNFVTMHLFEKGALYGMLKYGNENFKNRSNVYSAMHTVCEGFDLSRDHRQVISDQARWKALEQRCR